ncbi:MAG: polysaccharide biosynthesis/export family protein, partial [Pseudomonadota bacterium]
MTVMLGVANAQGEYRLDSGDQVKVTVFGHPDLSGEFEIDGSGRVSLPLIRIVQAKGLTATELEQEITNKLKPDYLKNPKVSVEVQEHRPFYIIGEVKTPG